MSAGALIIFLIENYQLPLGEKMSNMCQKKDKECLELLFIMPQLFVLVVKTLIDNRLTIRSRIVSLCRTIRLMAVKLVAARSKSFSS
jgi:hypothetical protein